MSKSPIAILVGLLLGSALLAAPAKPLSPRALEIQKMKSRDREALDARCRVQTNWKTPDCLARLEVEDADRAEWLQSRKDSEDFLREECAGGDQNKCIELACPTDAGIFFRTAKEVRACARARGLPVDPAAHWVQTSEEKDNYQQRFGIVCLDPIYYLTPYGVKRQVFAGNDVRWLVTTKPGPKAYEAAAIQDKTFPTLEAAAVAGCAAERPRHAGFLKLGGSTLLN